MMKMKIEGTEIHYKNVADLNEKIRQALTKAQKRRAHLGEEYRLAKRKEKAFMKFLGMKDEVQKDDTSEA